jgi:hypothetical protein
MSGSYGTLYYFFYNILLHLQNYPIQIKQKKKKKTQNIDFIYLSEGRLQVIIPHHNEVLDECKCNSSFQDKIGIYFSANGNSTHPITQEMYDKLAHRKINLFQSEILAKN